MVAVALIPAPAMFSGVAGIMSVDGMLVLVKFLAVYELLGGAIGKLLMKYGGLCGASSGGAILGRIAGGSTC
jgi:hypothetical protein